MKEQCSQGTQERFKYKDTQEKLSNSLSLSLVLAQTFSLYFSKPLHLLPFSSFYRHFPLLFQLFSPQLDFGEYLSHQAQPSTLLFHDHEERFLKVFPLFKPIIQFLMWLTLGRDLINVEVTVSLGSASSSLCLLGKMQKIGSPT